MIIVLKTIMILKIAAWTAGIMIMGVILITLLFQMSDIYFRFLTPTGRSQARATKRLRKKNEEVYNLLEFARKLDITEGWYVEQISQLDHPKTNTPNS